MNILLGMTGSVASILHEKLVESLSAHGEVQLVLTEKGRHFVRTAKYKIHTDNDEWNDRYEAGQDILHIELRKWADVLVIAPLSANTMAKMANGICDNLLTSVVRAWDWKKRMVLVPAMNTHMWQSPLTRNHLSTLTSFGAKVVNPISKVLACGDEGIGAMAHIDDIIKAL